MARIRTIKPELFTNDRLAECSLEARYLYIGLFCLADRRGRLENRPKRIKIEVFPYDEVDAEKLIGELAEKGYLVLYSGDVEGETRSLIQINGFEKHQRITGKEAENESIYPAPTSGETTGKQRGNNGEAPEKHPGAQEGKGRERKGKEEERASAREEPPPEEVQEPPKPGEPTFSTLPTGKPEIKLAHSVDISPEERAPPFLLAWFRAYAKESGRLVNYSPSDLQEALTLKARIPDAETLSGAVTHYWAHWRDLWFACRKDDKARAARDKRGAWSFRGFVQHVDEIIAGMVEETPGEEVDYSQMTFGRR